MAPIHRFSDEYDIFDEIDRRRSSRSTSVDHKEDYNNSKDNDDDSFVMDEFTEIKEQVYQEKLASLKKQLDQLRDGTHPEYNKRLKKLEQAYRERLRGNVIWRDHMTEIVKKEHVADKKAIAKELEDKKVELKDNLIADLEEKRKATETERLSNDIFGEQTEPKPALTRKLRRRPNDPLPAPDKRRKNPQIQLRYVLDEKDIDEDMKEINAIKFSTMSNKKSGSNSPVVSAVEKIMIECKIEDGKLMYERRWFLRGQPVFIEGRAVPKFPAVISAIGTEALWVKKTADGSKFRINLLQLIKGKMTIKRRAA